jgi:hypothetical protein
VTKYPGIIQHLHFVFDSIRGELFKEPFENLRISKKNNVLGSHGADIFWGLLKTVTKSNGSFPVGGHHEKGLGREQAEDQSAARHTISSCHPKLKAGPQ